MEIQTNRLLPFDNLDNRKEVLNLLNQLMPADRVLFAQFACLNVPGIKGKGVHFRARKQLIQAATRDKKGMRSNEANTNLTNQIYMDLLVACTQFEMNATILVDLLEMAVRHGVRNLERSLSDLCGISSSDDAKIPQYTFCKS